MKRFLSVLLALLLFSSPAFAASKVPGPPERFKDWPQVAEKWGNCPDGRLIQLKAYAKVATFGNVGLTVFQDAIGPFIWLFYTDKDEDADTRVAWWFDGAVYWTGTLDELRALYDTPCNIPRPFFEQKR